MTDIPQKKIQINLLKLDENNTPEEDDVRRTRSFASSLFIKCFILLIGVSLVITGTVTFSSRSSEVESPSFMNIFTSLLGTTLPSFGFNKDRELQGVREDRINILLLGIGGENHDGGQLTDTIILASIKPSTKQTAFISLPRDLLVPLQGYGWRKINNANAFGEVVEKGRGIAFTKEVISSLLQIPIHYTIRVDFQGFVELIDLLDGIDVDVEKAFTDDLYPTTDWKYQTIRFEAGQQHMSGARALMFARSRHSAQNNEGSDFARSKRQQKLLRAVRERMLSTSFLLNPKKINEVMSTLQEHILTNAKSRDIAQLILLVKDIDLSSMKSLTIDDAPGGLVYPDVVEGGFVLRPRDGTFDALRLSVDSIFETSEQEKGLTGIEREQPTIVIKNGTAKEGLAGKTARYLKTKGFRVLETGNADRKDYRKTLVVESGEAQKKSESGLFLKNIFSGDVTTTDSSQTFDFLIILGEETALRTHP